MNHCHLTTASQQLSRPAPGSLSLRLTTRVLGPSQVAEALAEWRQLDLRLANQRVACGAAWTEGWLTHFGDLVEPHFLVGERNGSVQAMALLVRSRHVRVGPMRLRTLHVGTAGEPHGHSVCVEDNALLAAPDCAAEFQTAVFAHGLALGGWDEFRWDGFAIGELEPVLTGERGGAVRARSSRYFDLRAAREAGTDVISGLGKSTRSNLRRRVKQLGAVKVEWSESLATASEIFGDLVRLHQARWRSAGQPGAFASDRFRRFQEHLVSALVPTQQVVLARVSNEQQTIGCLLLLVDQNRLLDYVSGFASFEEVPGAGMATHYLCMEEALRRGYDAYDFLVGDKRHKLNLGPCDRELAWGVLSRRTWRNGAIAGLRRLKQLYRRPAVSAAAQDESGADA